MARKMGKTQMGVMRSLDDHGRYHGGCGWVWGTHRQTVKILETLVARGYVERNNETVGFVNPSTRDVYRTTHAGMDAYWDQYEKERGIA